MSVFFDNTDGFNDGFRISLVKGFCVCRCILLESDIVNQFILRHHDGVRSGNGTALPAQGNGVCPGGFGFFLMLCNFIENKQNYKMLYFTMLLAIACSMFLYLYFKNRERKAVSFIAMALCLLLTVAELSFDAKVVMFNMQSTMAGDYPGYVEAQTAQIRDVKAYDDGLYRISQTRCRSINNYNTMSEYNESMAYNYWSAASYSSTRDLMNLEFMDRIGYRNEENCMSIVNTSVLPSDALLGIRYVLSADPIPGLQEISELERRNGKSVYENPYALPMAFVYDGAGVLCFKLIPEHMTGKLVNES